MDDKEFCEFWKYLLDKADDDEAYWLESWLERTKEEWDALPVCECGHRVPKTEEVWSKTRNYVLERHVRCANCGKLIETRDNREQLIQWLKDGHVRVKDVAILTEEVGMAGD